MRDDVAAMRLAHACPECNGCVNLDTMTCDKCGVRIPDAATVVGCAHPTCARCGHPATAHSDGLPDDETRACSMCECGGLRFAAESDRCETCGGDGYIESFNDDQTDVIITLCTDCGDFDA